MAELLANAQHARWWRSRSANVELGRIFSWLPVLLAASFPLATVAALMAGRQAPAARQASADSNPPSLTTFSLVIPGAFTDEVSFWAPDILRWSLEYELPPALVATVMQIESCGNPSVRSNAGAAGLFQVMPYHFGVGENPFEPETNAFRGLSYLSRSLELAEGDLALALAGYNGGHGQISRPPNLWPAETQRYVRWGTEILTDVQQGTLPSPGINSWLQAGGASLCRRAAVAQASG
ncbi:MAG: lytic transglycosylase domain-containing protein [Anaerolineales bacterium]|nr:lytic transglycosylase domain-containing protein [Anaerolineales bacterium]